MRLFIILFCSLISLRAAASVVDSIGVENHNGYQVILHKVAPKETYYSIARLYNVSPRGLVEFNNNIGLHVGTVVKVLTSRPLQSKTTQNRPASNTTNASENSSSEIVEYKVGAREYLYSIARRFNTTVEDIKQLNNLRSNSLSIGQILKIRPGQGVSVPQNTPPPISPAPVLQQADTPSVEKPKIPTSRLGLSERTEKGVAVWISDENLDGSKMLALHRNAPIGTVIKITNPMTERATFAKVVGKFTENETTKDVIVVLTKATAELLGALDKRFLVTIDYGMPNE